MSRTFPDRRVEDVVDPTQPERRRNPADSESDYPSTPEQDKRRERNRFAAKPDTPSAFMDSLK